MHVLVRRLHGAVVAVEHVRAVVRIHPERVMIRMQVLAATGAERWVKLGRKSEIDEAIEKRESIQSFLVQSMNEKVGFEDCLQKLSRLAKTNKGKPQ